MNKVDLISSLKANNYSFEDKGEQVIVKLARRYFLKLSIENDIVVKNEDMLKQFSLWTNGKRLKAVAKINMIFDLIFIFFIVLWYIIDPYFFYSLGGKVFIMMIALGILSQLVEFLYYNNRLSKIKKLLNLND